MSEENNLQPQPANHMISGDPKIKISPDRGPSSYTFTKEKDGWTYTSSDDSSSQVYEPGEALDLQLTTDRVGKVSVNDATGDFTSADLYQRKALLDSAASFTISGDPNDIYDVRIDAIQAVRILNLNSGKYLRANDAQTGVIQDTLDPDDPRFHWRVLTIGHGLCRIYAHNTSKIICQSENGTQLEIDQPDNVSPEANLVWLRVDNLFQMFTNTKNVWGVPDRSTDDGAPVHTFQMQTGDNPHQQFELRSLTGKAAQAPVV